MNDDALSVLNVHSGNLYGGIEAFHTTMAHVALQAGITEEFAMCFDDRPAKELREAGVPVHLLGQTRMRKPLSLMRARGALARLLSSGRFRVAVTHSTWSHAIFGGTIRRSGVPLVLHLHDSVPELDWLGRLASRTRPALVLCNSRYTASTLPNLFPHANYVVVNYPVAPRAPSSRARQTAREKLGAAEDTVVILQASRMQSWKGHELHIKALAQLPASAPWTCWMAGGAQRPEESAYEARLRSMVEGFGLAEKVKFLGQRSDVPDLMAAADIFCQPNATPEPFGIVFVEALAAGLPVVATAMGGAAEIVDERCGVLAPPGDVNAVANGLRRLIEDPQERRGMAEPAKARARTLCDPLAQTMKLQEALATVAQTPGTRPRSARAWKRLAGLVHGAR